MRKNGRCKERMEKKKKGRCKEKLDEQKERLKK